jgi:hypothetical protein
MASTVCDLVPGDIHVIALPGLRLSESGFRNLSELDRFGVVLFSDGRDGELNDAIESLKSRSIPYLIGLEKRNEREFSFLKRSHPFFLLSQKKAEIRQTIGQFIDRLQRHEQCSTSDAERQGKAYIWVRSAHRDIKIFLNEIIYLSSDKDYVFINFADKSIAIRNSLKSVHLRLMQFGFERVHKSYIVQLNQVSEIRTLARNQHEVQLINGTRLPIGRTYWPTMRRWLQAQQMERSQHERNDPSRARLRRA